MWVDSERSGGFRAYFSGPRQFGAREGGLRERIEQSLFPSTRKIACNHPFLRLPGRQSFNPRNPALGLAPLASQTEKRKYTAAGPDSSRSISSEE